MWWCARRIRGADLSRGIVTPSPEFVQIHYLRPPDRREVFEQRLLLDAPEVKVTLAENVPFDPPIQILGEVALEAGSDAVWFTFPGLWHDIGRFHRADGTFTGIYANILTPPVIEEGGVWETTDLFLDIWLNVRDEFAVLDEDQLKEAVVRGWITENQAARASAEVEWIRKEYLASRWPPPVVLEWTLEKARQASSSTTHAAQRRFTSR
jgi:predicted RNA-binding protein associated with RNAse of E/G family